MMSQVTFLSNVDASTETDVKVIALLITVTIIAEFNENEKIALSKIESIKRMSNAELVSRIQSVLP